MPNPNPNLTPNPSLSPSPACPLTLTLWGHIELAKL